jgi:muramidase (phage lysozyme)
MGRTVKPAVFRAVAVGAGLLGLKAASDAAAKAQAGGASSAVLGGLAAAGAYNPLQVLAASVAGRRVRDALAVANVRAALDVIAWAEGTAQKPDPYRVCYGYRHTIADFSKHPKALGWRGEPLDSLGPKYKGLVSTAAGKYQINFPTWSDASRALGLVDFSPASQDAAAVWIMDQAGALEQVKAGAFGAAVAKLARRWASFPGGTSGQPTRRVGDLVAKFNEKGGAIA